MSGKHTPGPEEMPYIWLQEQEQTGRAECGCRLTFDVPGGAGTEGPAFFQCPMHDATPKLLAALEEAEEFLRPSSSKRVSIRSLEVHGSIRTAIRKARGEE